MAEQLRIEKRLRRDGDRALPRVHPQRNEAQCAECHRRGGKSVPLALASQVILPDPTNLVQVTVHGINPPQGSLGRSMPARGAQISDKEIVALVRFVRARFSRQAPWSNITDAVRCDSE